MLAYAYTSYGSPDVVKKVNIEKPIPKPNEVLVQIYATTVSAGDWRARSLTMPQGLGFMGRLVFGITGPRKPVLGTEFSGVIEAVGAEVTNYSPGDAVIGFPGADFGAHAEFITMPANGKLTRKPANMTFEQAAAIPFGFTAAYDFLVNKAQLQPGQSVLINGGSGAVGSACIQIAKYLGADVVAVCSGRNADLVRSLGADQVIDYTSQNVIAHGVYYDLVVDTVGTLPWRSAQKGLRRGGKMVLIAGKTSDMLLGYFKAALNGKTMIGGVASESPDVLGAVVDLAEKAAVRPIIDRSYSFHDLNAAHAHVDTGHKKGSVVVAVQPS